VNAFIDHVYTPLGTTSNYSVTANLHNSQITTPTAKPFPACCAFISRVLATDLNSGDFSASRSQVLSSHLPVQNSTLNSLLTTNNQAGGHSYTSLHRLNFRLTTNWVKIKVGVTLRLAVYRQSVHLGVKPLETHDQRFLFN
jgi:hypothetical protein